MTQYAINAVRDKLQMLDARDFNLFEDMKSYMSQNGSTMDIVLQRQLHLGFMKEQRERMRSEVMFLLNPGAQGMGHESRRAFTTDRNKK